MKKMLFIILATVLTTAAGAQIQFGIKAGLNLATFTNSGYSVQTNQSSKTDFSGGVLALVPLFNTFYLQPEIMYSGQGTKSEAFGEEVKFNYDYLNVPVLFKFQHETGLFAETGPQVGFLLSAKIKSDSGTEDNKDDSQSVDFSWAFGVGYKIPNINGGIDIRYNLGLTNVAKDSGSQTVKNSVFQFSLFYLFGGE